MYSQGEIARNDKFCQICKCGSGGRWKSCVDDHSCSVSQFCDWSQWSSWGPCYGSCGRNGTQWAFRISFYPNRYVTIKFSPLICKQYSLNNC